MQKLQPKLRFPEFDEDWELVTLQEVSSKIGDGLHGTPEYVNDSEYFFINGNNLSNGVINIFSNSKKVSEPIFFKNDKKLNQNSILISLNGTIGSIAKYNNEKIMLSKSVGFINFSNDSDLFYHILNTKKVQNFFESELTGSTIKNLSLKTLRDTIISIPQSLPEQTKIASFLTTVDEKISGLKKQLTLLERYKKGVMQKIFSQKLRFQDENGNDFPDWEEKKLGEICNIKRGASPRPITDKKWFDNNSKIGWVRISDISKSNKYLEKTEQYFSPSAIDKSRFVKKGNMIMSICATLGKPIYTNIDVCIPDSFIVFEKLSLEKEYFFYYLDFIQLNWYKYGQPGTQVNLNSEIVSNETIPVPSNFEQQKIASFLSSIDEKIKKRQCQIKAMDKWKKGLLQQMFV